ncbi:Uma2 family endonuclease [[Limnothrix rosea] IAM M-220]|uniref:Uma2 family endonuclease n=1 Tax=[Limnothrix rosea] IAM M-220 TaxID=454133 RepID=UPI0009668320|nr:Uma2 family endonuclease [[Limnothrix rosea] IAM M-220]OKH12497.1 hypothetical protein NIES208_16140 [[Limnothrix rosea] IAM M-220]
MVSTERVRWTTEDLELLPDNGTRYEIVDGDLHITCAPHWNHQKTCIRIGRYLDEWSAKTQAGEVAAGAGVLFDSSDDVIPDVVWISREKLATLLDDAGHLTGAPELVVEVLSAGTTNEKRDRQAKLKLYSVQGVLEYWIADWRQQKVEIYRRENAVLKLTATLFAEDKITSPLLPEFQCLVSRFFV